MRHAQPQEAFAEEAKQCFHDVQLEPPLEPLSGEQMKHKSAITSDDARSDLRIRSFWTNMSNAFLEFRVLDPFAVTHSNKSPSVLYKSIANIMRREYGQRVREVEDGDFTPMIMSSTGGMGPEMHMALKHLANKLVDKKGGSYSRTMSLLRCKFAFAMARAALVCLRGSRGLWPKRASHGVMDSVELSYAELRL